jgi:hypothetical protein
MHPQGRYWFQQAAYKESISVRKMERKVGEKY